MVDVQSAELLFVDAHQVISLSFDQPLLYVVPREGGQVVVAYVKGLQINRHFSYFLFRFSLIDNQSLRLEAKKLYLIVEKLDVPELKDLIRDGKGFHQPESTGNKKKNVGLKQIR